jgi:hypothetical protein
MAKPGGFEKKSYSQLAQLRDAIDHLMLERRVGARADLHEEMAGMAEAQGLTLDEVLGKHGRAKGAAECRDGWWQRLKAAK